MEEGGAAGPEAAVSAAVGLAARHVLEGAGRPKNGGAARSDDDDGGGGGGVGMLGSSFAGFGSGSSLPPRAVVRSHSILWLIRGGAQRGINIIYLIVSRGSGQWGVTFRWT